MNRKTEDSQGNIRVVFDRNGNVEQTTDYYPYGMPMTNLYWRVRGYNNFYRDGSDHTKYSWFTLDYNTATGIPAYLRYDQ